MSAIVLKGIKVVKSIEADLKARIAAYAACLQRPKLVIVRVGGRADDEAYERGAIKRCGSVGIMCESRAYDSDISNNRFVEEFTQINADPSVHGILVMSPLPAGIDAGAVKTIIDPVKDVDCISPVNVAKLYSGDMSGHAPCTPSAVMELLKYYQIEISGKLVTVVGRSPVVGKPLAMLLLAANATLTICHTRTADLAGECRRADILVAAAGKARMLGADCVKPGAVVVDVGINVGEAGTLYGDVDYDAAAAIAGGITPVPGGVGAVTTAILAKHTLDAYAYTRTQGDGSPVLVGRGILDAP